jgi:hypothetical protein
VLLDVAENLVKSLGNAVGGKRVGELLTVGRERQQSNAIAIRRTNESSIAAKAELLDESLPLVGLGAVVQQSTAVLLDVRSTNIPLVHRDDSCIDSMRSFSQSSTASLVVWDVSRPQIQNLLGVDQRRSQHRRRLIGNDLNVFVVLAIRHLVVVIVVWWWIDLNIWWIWIRQSIRLIARAAGWIACITVVAGIAAEGDNLRVGLTSVGILIAKDVFLEDFRDGRRLVVVRLKFLYVVNARPLRAFVVAVVSWECAPAVRMNL